MGLRVWTVPACAAAAGLIAGFILANGIRKDEAIPRATAVTPEPGQAGGSDATRRSLSLEDVRRVVREELAAHDAGAQRPGSDMHEPLVTVPPESAAPSMAASQAEQLLASAVNRRQWTDADAAALHAQFYAMSGEEQAEVLRRFSRAVNQGQLTVESDRVPF
jgi:hypothetical protein